MTGAGVDDGVAAPLLLAHRSPVHFPRRGLISGASTEHNPHLHAWRAAHRPHWRLAVKTRPAGTQGWTPLETRWVVERPKAWPGRYRRHRKDYARQPTSSAAMMHISPVQLLVNRLAPRQSPAFHYREAAA
jgi:transposase